MAFFVNLGGSTIGRESWWNVDQIVKIERRVSEGATDHGIPYVVTFANGVQLGIAEGDFRKIMAQVDGAH